MQSSGVMEDSEALVTDDEKGRLRSQAKDKDEDEHEDKDKRG